MIIVTDQGKTQVISPKITIIKLHDQSQVILPKISTDHEVKRQFLGL